MKQPKMSMSLDRLFFFWRKGDSLLIEKREQGYYEEQIDKILELNSDAQAYKQAGNGVTVNVIEAIGRRLFQVHSGIHILQ